MKLSFILFAVLFSFQLSARSWHVKPSENELGSRPGGNGSVSKPWDLQTALVNAKKMIKAGDTVWVHGGTYWGYWGSVITGGGKILAPVMYVSVLEGTVHKPIIVKAYPGEQPVFTGDHFFGIDNYKSICPRCAELKAPLPLIMLKVMGKNAWYWGLEFTEHFNLRESHQPGEGAPNIKEGSGVTVIECDSIKLINLVVHDIPGLGISGYSSARNTEVYGCISYYNGFSDVPLPGDKREGFRKNGPGIYMQNDSTAARPSVKIIEDNIVFKNFSLGMEIYGSKNAHVNHFKIRNNVVFNNGAPGNSIQKNLLLGGGMTTFDNELSGNIFFIDDARGAVNVALGFKKGVENTKCLIRNNYFIDGTLDMLDVTDLKFHNNLFVGQESLVFRWQDCPLPPELKNPSLEYISNVFYHGYPKGLFYYGIDYCSDHKECEAGLNADLNFQRYNIDPLLGNAKGNILTRRMDKRKEVIIRPNRYDPGQAEVVVLNWDTAATALLPLGDYIPKGSSYELTDVQNLKGNPVIKAIYAGNVSVPTTLKDVQVPVGYGDTVNHTMVLPGHTFEVMNVFLLKYFPYQVKLSQTKHELEANLYNAAGKEIKGENTFKYIWKRNGKEVAETAGPNLRIKEGGDYTVEVVMQNMMSGTAKATVKL